MSTFWHDLRYGGRKLLRAPGFTLTATATIALAIGANTAIFSVVHAVLLEPLPYADPDRLVLVWNRMANSTFEKVSISSPDVVDYREEARLFEGFAAVKSSELALTGAGKPEQIQVARVTANFFSILGVEPFLGRDFTPEDEGAFPPEVFEDPDATVPSTAILLSHGFWERRFGGDPEVLGRGVWIEGQPMTVVGVLPPGFELLMPPEAAMPTDIDAWKPIRLDLAAGARDAQWLRVIARLKSGVSLAQAQAEMDAIAERQRERFQFHKNMGIYIDVEPMHADVVGHVRPTLLALFGAVGFVLLIACANVANLLLARIPERGREIVIRTALGAGRARIIRQVLTEGLLLALLGGAAGLLLARAGIPLLLELQPTGLPRVDAIVMDGKILVFTLGATLLAALVSALAPALVSSSVEASEALAERGAGGGRQPYLSSALVTEVALSLVLLIGAGLMLKSFALLHEVRPGFEPEGVLTAKLRLPESRYGSLEERVGFFRRAEERIASLPGVKAVGAVFPMPLAGRLWTGPYGREEESPDTWSRNEGNFRVTTPGYFAAMGTRLLSGRFFTAADVEGEQEVAIVDRLLAERLWPGEDPLGKRLGVDIFGDPRKLRVVGVVEHVRHTSLAEDDRETIYFPHHVFPWFPMTFAVRSSSDPVALAAPVAAEVAAMDADLPVFKVRTLADYVERSMADTRFAMVLIAVFAGVALVLASVGLYGVLSYSVRRRRREIGIRMALGAPHGRILRQFVGRGLLLTVAGLGLGLVAAFIFTPTIGSLLFGVEPTDPATFVALSLLLATVALVACYLPARRAARVDPVSSLRR